MVAPGGETWVVLWKTVRKPRAHPAMDCALCGVVEVKHPVRYCPFCIERIGRVHAAYVEAGMEKQFSMGKMHRANREWRI